MPQHTLPDTSIVPEMDDGNTTFLLGWLIFGGELLVLGRVQCGPLPDINGVITPINALSMGNWGYTVTLLIIGFWAHLAPIGYVLCIGRSYIIYPWMLLLRSKLYLLLILVGKGHPDHFAITSAGQTECFFSVFDHLDEGVYRFQYVYSLYIYILCIYVFHYIYVHAAPPSKMTLCHDYGLGG